MPRKDPGNVRRKNSSKGGIKYDWDKIRQVINDVIDDCIRRYGVEPSVRLILYRLRDLGLLPATEPAYKALSRMLTKWREEVIVDWRKIRDAREERTISYMEPIEYYRESLLTVDEMIEIVKRRIENEFNVDVNPWMDQKYRIIVHVEKNGDYYLVKRLVEEVWPFGVYAIHSSAGYDSTRWKFELSDIVKRISDQGYTPVILSFGDLDPSGVDIDRDFVEKVKKYSAVQNLIWERVAVTKDQVERYGLTGYFRSDEEYLRFMRDSRRKKFEERFGLIKVELSEFFASVPLDEVKRIIREKIEKYFDWNIYNAVTKSREEELKRKAEEAKKQSLELLEKIRTMLKQQSL